MDKIVKLLSDYVSKCARCFYYKVDDCGYVNRSLEAPELSKKEYDALIPSEQTLFNTKKMHIPCEHQLSGFQLIEKIDSLAVGAYMSFSSKWLLNYLTKLNEIKEKARNERKTFQSSILIDLNRAIAHTLTRIDLIFLKNGFDIGYFLGLVDMSNDRISRLNTICPPKIVKHYLKQASPLDGYCEQNDQTEESKEADLNLLMKKVKSAFGVIEPRFPDRSASFELKAWMRDQRNVAILEFVLVQFGYAEVVGDYSVAEEYVDSKETKKLQEWLYTDFGRWDELKEELFGIAERNSDNLLVLQRTLGKQVEACSSLARYCFPPAEAGILEKEAAVLIRLLANAHFPQFEEAIELWEGAKKEAAQIAKPNMDQSAYLDTLYRLSLENAGELKSSSTPYALLCVGRVRNYMGRLAILVESALFRYCPSLKLAGLEQPFNITISDGVSQDDIFHELGWHTTKEIQALEQVAGEKVDTPVDEKQYQDNQGSGEQELSEDDEKYRELRISKRQELLAGYLDGGGQPIIMDSYLGALRRHGYLDENNKWINEGHTKYEAGWAAKIIVNNVPEVKYKTIEDLFGLSGLADAACKCNTHNKDSVKKRMEACFSEKGLRVMVV